ncbi:MAG: flagellar motor protein MotB [Actinomycetota bacterium]|nr:flagellar motor protein MotB [Actinomycetota bacterium]
MSKRHKKHHEDHDEHPSEAWLIALADMMTLLMVTFLMMFAISVMDLKKFQTFKEAFAEGTGTSLPKFPGEGVPTVGEITETPLAPPDGTTDPKTTTTGEQAADVLDRKDLTELAKKINQQLAEAGISDEVEARITKRGLVVYVTNGVLFDSGEAEVTRPGTALLEGLGVILAGIGNDLVVEGHTDKRPIRSAKFASNWELSAMRATAVARQLMDTSGIPGKRVAIAGYADTRPRQDAATSAAYAANRRVEIVVELPPEVAPAETPAAAPAGAAGSGTTGKGPAHAEEPAAEEAPAEESHAEEDSGH